MSVIYAPFCMENRTESSWELFCPLKYVFRESKIEQNAHHGPFIALVNTYFGWKNGLSGSLPLVDRAQEHLIRRYPPLHRKPPAGLTRYNLRHSGILGNTLQSLLLRPLKIHILGGRMDLNSTPLGCTCPTLHTKPWSSPGYAEIGRPIDPQHP